MQIPERTTVFVVPPPETATPRRFCTRFLNAWLSHQTQLADGSLFPAGQDATSDTQREYQAFMARTHCLPARRFASDGPTAQPATILPRVQVWCRMGKSCGFCRGASIRRQFQQHELPAGDDCATSAASRGRQGSFHQRLHTSPKSSLARCIALQHGKQGHPRRSPESIRARLLHSQGARTLPRYDCPAEGKGLLTVEGDQVGLGSCQVTPMPESCVRAERSLCP